MAINEPNRSSHETCRDPLGAGLLQPGSFTQQPDRLIVMVDEGKPNDGNFKPIRSSTLWADEPHWPHGKTSSFGYFDGHVVRHRSDNDTIVDHFSPVWFPRADECEIVE